MWKRGTSIIIAAVLAAGLTACEDPLTGEDEVQNPPPSPAPGATGSPPASGAPVQPPPQPGGVLASREFQDAGLDLRADITGLVRQGQTVLLSWTITNTGGEDSWHVSYSLTATDEPTSEWSVSGVTLVDTVNGQRYLVARSGGEEGPCVCTTTDSLFIEPGQAAQFDATYSAPPPDVTVINVEMPVAGTFTDVPIS